MNTQPQRRNPVSSSGSPATLWRRWCLPSVHGPRAVLEVVIGMAVLVVLCNWLHPVDPLLLQSGFPWLGLLALVFALRYGALLGVLAGACLLLAWWWLYGNPGAFPKAHFVGLFALLVLAGHFSDLWAGRLRRETGVRQYLSTRLVSLTNSYYLLRASHDRLERELLSRPTTVRDTVAHLRESISNDDLAATALPKAQSLMDYLASICQINEAAIFPIQENGVPGGEAAAQVGEPLVLNPHDPLLLKSLETGQLAHAREITESESSDYLVCAPLRTAGGQTLGMLVIRRMRFMALNHDNLQLILVMLAYYADSIRQRPAIAAVQKYLPECPEAFALELSRLSHLNADGGPDSYLVALTFQKDGLHQAAFEQLARQRRALDLSWEYETPDARALIVLLSLTEKWGVDGYVERVEQILQDQFGLSFQGSRIGVYSQAVNARTPGASLKDFVGTWSAS